MDCHELRPLLLDAENKLYLGEMVGHITPYSCPNKTNSVHVEVCYLYQFLQAEHSRVWGIDFFLRHFAQSFHKVFNSITVQLSARSEYAVDCSDINLIDN